MTMSRIIVDAFGGDNAPACCIQGALLARQKWGMDVAVVGDAQAIRSCAAKEGLSLDDIEIIGANGVIEMCDDPGEILKSKKDCSMAEGLRRAGRSGEGDAFVSAGSTGALVVGATLYRRAASRGSSGRRWPPSVPTRPPAALPAGRRGAPTPSAAPRCWRSFGVMGSAYMERVMGDRRPQAWGSLNVGTEGPEGRRACSIWRPAGCCRTSPLQLHRQRRGAGRPSGGGRDVVVCDGFTGQRRARS